MKVGKPQSKRVSVRLRHKIQKASANKQRKERKEAKKNPQWRSRLKKDPGVPNLFPYKDKVLAEIEENKRRKEEEKAQKRDIARAQREGRAVDATDGAATLEIDVSDDDEGDDAHEEDDEMDEREDANPMAALVASASQRARAYTKDDEQDEEEDDEEDGHNDMTAKPTSKSAEPQKKRLPKEVFDEPIKPVSRLISRLQKTPDGLQQLLEYYQLPPLVTAGSDVTTRFLVDVARKRGRLSRGGVPNLQAAALTVLSDLQEQRLKLPALQQRTNSAATSKGEVRIVSQLAEPFKIEGLFGDTKSTGGAMDIEG
ncbi:Putative GTP-binding protein, orthogonal bundle domain superfamily [Septoria linicola]|uniref:GTP-binding protein, orthogonal bundle domain superfamily n=1 Tax=Septoria linicola TaxID=215465 RepID=A0A9Q9AHJ3_9PEZI|nr:putative GTP-binding protein, orthogonal bundle domain superfamily [Septoria linicola]USW47814.1 Putative GTP-binding protein, orthogonal bundle domain superfamily [Septoria linicola]